MKNSTSSGAREGLGSRLGFILLSAGCAIGLGNVWKFPYMVGQNGGGLFVLLYLVFLLIIGIPVMTMEFSLGRASRKSPIALYTELEPKGSKWHWHGYLAFGGNIILMMFYTSVAGWLLQYFFKTVMGDFEGLSAAEVSAEYASVLADPWAQILFLGIVVLLGAVICAFGVKNSLERVTKVMMLALLLLMVIIAVNGFFLDGAGEGLKFYLVPNFDSMKEIGLFNIVTGALSQAFFTLSLGIGSMAIFGSYIGKDRALFGESVNIALLDTFVAIVSGLIIFPACFTYNEGKVGAGPPLIFETLPNVFNNMPLGRLWGALFFLFLSFAALSTVFAVFENIIACIIDKFGFDRTRASVICGVGIFVLSLPCILGYNAWAAFKPFGDGSTVLDLEDFIVSNILLPVGSLVFVLFCTRKCGWGYESFLAEANEGKGLKVAKWMHFYIKYILPMIMAVFCVFSIVSPFIG